MDALLAIEPQIFTVSELTRSIRELLEENIGQTWVEGEVSNLRRQSSGHLYFTLKDDRSQLSCVMFRGSAAKLGTPLDDGMQVQVFGELSVYEARGQYQMIVQIVQPRGVGALQARFEALKRKLQGEGLFDNGRKRPLPPFPQTVGLVTSPSAAALQDMLNILARRAPSLRVLVNPVRVQGNGAALEIARAVREFSDWSARGDEQRAVDLIVVARGGGSIEDLFEFNEEAVARAIFDAAVPVVSAVGHEIDFTIADFVADLRAPTPSAAAELIAPDTDGLLRQLEGAAQFLKRRLQEGIVTARDRLGGFTRGGLDRELKRRLADERQRLDTLEEELNRSAGTALQLHRTKLEQSKCCLRAGDLGRAVELRAQALHAAREKMETLLCCERGKFTARLQAAQGLLRVLGPQATLERGYSITLTESGEPVRSVATVARGRRIITRVQDGEVSSTVD